MSAFMVSKAHIDLMVQTAIDGPAGLAPQNWHPPYFRQTSLNHRSDLANELGEMLVKENLSSIHARYPDTLENPDDTPGPTDQYWLKPYEFEEHQFTKPGNQFSQTRRLTIAEAMKAFHCYEYQSCEHPEWKGSEAQSFCEGMLHSLMRGVPGYDDAPWEFDVEEVSE